MRKLYFRNSNNENILLCETDDRALVTKKIFKFLEEKNFKSYYVRTWKEDGYEWFDVGSHTEFFIWEL